MMTAEQVLRGAIERIRAGFHKGAWMNDTGCFCAWGALRAAAGGRPCPGAEYVKPPPQTNYAAYDAAYEVLEGVVGSVPAFNDAPNVTQDDVIAALEIAADLAAPPYDAGADVSAGG